MKRRDLFQAAIAAVAGLFEVSRPSKAKSAPREPIEPVLCFEGRSPPAPAPGQVWESRAGHRLLILSDHEVFWRWFDMDTSTVWRLLGISLPSALIGMCYLGDIRDLAKREKYVDPASQLAPEKFADIRKRMARRQCS